MDIELFVDLEKYNGFSEARTFATRTSLTDRVSREIGNIRFGEARILRFQGIPGSGKSTLASDLLYRLKKSKTKHLISARIEIKDNEQLIRHLVHVFKQLLPYVPESQSSPIEEIYFNRFIMACVRFLEREQIFFNRTAVRAKNVGELAERTATTLDASSFVGSLLSLGGALNNTVLAKIYRSFSDEAYLLGIENDPMLRDLCDLSEQHFKETLLDIFVEMIRHIQQKCGVRYVFIVDNTELIQSRGRRLNWIEYLYRRLGGSLFLLLGHNYSPLVTNEEFKCGQYNHRVINCGVEYIDNLADKEIQEYVSQFHLPKSYRQHLINTKQTIQFIQLVIKQAVDHFENIGEFPHLDQLPKTLPEVYSRQLLDLNSNTSKLLTLLALTNSFDHELIYLLKKEFLTSLDEEDFERAQDFFRSETDMSDEIFFHITMKEHLRSDFDNWDVKKDTGSFESLARFMRVFFSYYEQKVLNHQIAEITPAMISNLCHTYSRTYNQLMRYVDNTITHDFNQKIIFLISQSNRLIIRRSGSVELIDVVVDIFKALRKVFHDITQRMDISPETLFKYLDFIILVTPHMLQGRRCEDAETAAEIQLDAINACSMLSQKNSRNEITLYRLLIEILFARTCNYCSPNSKTNLLRITKFSPLNFIRNNISRIFGIFESNLHILSAVSQQQSLCILLIKETHYLSLELYKQKNKSDALFWNIKSKSLMEKFESDNNLNRKGKSTTLFEDYADEIITLKTEIILDIINKAHISDKDLFHSLKAINTLMEKAPFNPIFLKAWTEIMIAISTKRSQGKLAVDDIRTIEKPLDTATDKLLSIDIKNNSNWALRECIFKYLLKLERKREQLFAASHPDSKSIIDAVDYIIHQLPHISIRNFKAITKEVISWIENNHFHNERIITSIEIIICSLQGSRASILNTSMLEILLDKWPSKDPLFVKLWDTLIKKITEDTPNVEIQILAKLRTVQNFERLERILRDIKQGDSFYKSKKELISMSKDFEEFSASAYREFLITVMSFGVEAYLIGKNLSTASEIYQCFSTRLVEANIWKLEDAINCLKNYKDNVPSTDNGYKKSEVKKLIKLLKQVSANNSRFETAMNFVDSALDQVVPPVALKLVDARRRYEIFSKAENQASGEEDILYKSRKCFLLMFVERLLHNNFGRRVKEKLNVDILLKIFDGFLRAEPKELASEFLTGLYEVKPSNWHSKVILAAKFIGIETNNGIEEFKFEHHEKVIYVPHTRELNLVSRPLETLLNKTGASTIKNRNIFILQIRGVNEERCEATMVGPEFIRSMLHIIFPTVLGLNHTREDVVLGGLNSWLVVKLGYSYHRIFISGGEVITNFLCPIMNLHRITSIPKPFSFDKTKEKTLIEAFISSTFKELQVIEQNESSIRLRLPRGCHSTYIKDRTFEQMFIKLFPNVEMLFEKESFSEDDFEFQDEFDKSSEMEGGETSAAESADAQYDFGV